MLSITPESYHNWRRTYYKRKDVRIYTNVALIFISMAILIMAAIQPTISTILQLRQQISASQELVNRMEAKISRLDQLQRAYMEVVDDIKLIDGVFPEALSPALLGRIIKTTARHHNLILTSLVLSNYSWPPQNQKVNKGTRKTDNITAYQASFSLTGSYQDVVGFIKDIEAMRLFIFLDSASLKAYGGSLSFKGSVVSKYYYDQI